MTERERLGPPPVEPLSDLAWSRVERGLWSRLDAAAHATAAPRAWRWRWLAAPALVAAAALALVFGLRGGERAVDATQTRVVTGASPTSVLVGDVHVTLDADSAVVMDPAASALLERGAAWFAVAPRGERPPFVVAAGDLVVRVIGTKFRVARSGEESAVEVDHGLVEVQFRGVRTQVGAGQRWTSRRPADVAPVRVADATAELGAQPAAPTDDRAARPGPQPAPEPPAPAQPRAAEPPAPAPQPAFRPERQPVTVPAPAVPPPPAQPEPRRPAPPAPATDDAPPPAKSAAPDPDAAMFRRLEALEPRSPSAAIDGYLELARRSARWAEPALYAAARLAADHQEPRAKALLQIYLQRFPSGANAADARTLLSHLPGAR